MQALILAGGFGTRLRPLTLDTPKPVVSLVNRPILAYQIELLKRAGITDIILSLNYQPDKIQAVMGDGKQYGVKINYVVEPEPLGTAGAVKFAEQFITETTVILNGDNLINLDIAEVTNFHKQHNALATIVSMTMENPLGYGLIEIDKNNHILRFLVKPKAEELEKLAINTVNAGTYVFEPEVLDFIPVNQPASFEYDVFPKLLEQKQNFLAFISNDSYWLDVGTPPRYLQAHQDIINHRVSGFTGADFRLQSEISATAEISENSIIGKNCKIADNAKVENSVLGENVALGVGVTIKNSVIGSHTEISDFANITDALIGKSCQIGKHSIINQNKVLGDLSVLTDYSQI